VKCYVFEHWELLLITGQIPPDHTPEEPSCTQDYPPITAPISGIADLPTPPITHTQFGSPA